MLAEVASCRDFVPLFSFTNQKIMVVVKSRDNFFRKDILNRAFQKGFDVVDFEELNSSKFGNFEGKNVFLVADFSLHDFEQVQKRVSRFPQIPVVYVATTQRGKRFAELTYKGLNHSIFLEKKCGPNRILDSGLALLRYEKYDQQSNQYA